MQVVIVTNATYRGETIEGTFGLVQDFTPFKGDVDKRRNGRGGAGFIKVMPEGDRLARLAPSMTKPVKLTVEFEGKGYVVGGAPAVAEVPANEGLPAGIDGCGAVALFETFTPPAGEPGSLEDTLAVLRAEFEAAKGAERDRLRKRLRRAEAKQTA